MALVTYSDSEASEAETRPPSKTSTKTASKSSSTNPQKPAFQKLIARSNPHQIQVTLPTAARASLDDEESNGEPPAKRTRVGGGGGGLGDFNSFLPAPKKTSTTQAAAAGGGGGRRGLGSGVSLKTGATPGFSRASLSASRAEEQEEEDEKDEEDEAQNAQDVPHVSGLSTAPEDSHNGRNLASATMESHESVQKPQTAMMFKPLSVARKPVKKKKAALPPDSFLRLHEGQSQDPPKPAKVSLFSLEKAEDHSQPDPEESYTPLVYEPWVTEAKKQQEEQQHNVPDASTMPPPPSEPESLAPAKTGPQRLDSIASDLNLSASAKRQLFGRSWNGNASDEHIRIANFNTDQEYAANELFRQAGEQQTHNPVRAIAAGKHSLKQLVNAVASQKDALEEQFATGRRNKKEAGSKYGW